MESPLSPPPALIPRAIAPAVREALDDTRVVLVAGPRQAGKTTLVRQLAGDDRSYFTLDDLTTLAAVRADPVSCGNSGWTDNCAGNWSARVMSIGRLR